MTQDRVEMTQGKTGEGGKFRFGFDEVSKEINEVSKRNLRKRFSNTMMVVDEVHNIRHQADSSASEKYKTRGKVGELLMLVARYAENMRLLLMSATPVFDSPLEIVQIANLLNANDKRTGPKSFT